MTSEELLRDVAEILDDLFPPIYGKHLADRRCQRIYDWLWRYGQFKKEQTRADDSVPTL